MPLSADEEEWANGLTLSARAVEERALRDIADAATSVRPKARLRGLLADVNRWVASLVDGARRWVAGTLPKAYQSGASASAASMGLRFDWTTPHREAVESLARRVWDDVAGTLQDVSATTQRAIRSLLDDAVRRQIVEGVPGPRASAELARAIQSETGAMTVTYRDGSRHAVSDYADTVSRTATATTRNAGTFAQTRDGGVTYMECFDGPDCQWTSHNTGGLANGTIVTIEFAEDHVTSHPRCARSYSPRPDIRTAEAAEEGRRFAPDEQDRMAAEERARAATRNVDGRPRGTLTASRAEGRAPRSARQPRTARTART